MPTPKSNPNLSQTKRKPVSYPFIFPSLWGQHSHKPWMAYYCILTCSWSLKVMTYTLDDTFSLLLNFPFFKQKLPLCKPLCCVVMLLFCVSWSIYDISQIASRTLEELQLFTLSFTLHPSLWGVAHILHDISGNPTQ